jgi:predicted ribosome quality control (RQC) complex YloA/Tae2 family protein
VNGKTLENISGEINSALAGSIFGKVFQLSRFQIAVDFRLGDSRYLFIGVEPPAPRIYLIKRRLRDLERHTGTPSTFALSLKKRLSGAELNSIEKIPGERVLKFYFSGVNELGDRQDHQLIIQLTGRSANIFLINEHRRIIDTVRDTFGPGQEIGDIYAPPARPQGEHMAADETQFESGGFESLSEALDTFYLEKEAENKFRSRVTAARAKLRQETAKREKLLNKLQADLGNHGDAEKWKRYGDLLLANIGTARRIGESIFVTDFYDEDLPEIEIGAGENISITDAAGKFFKRYTKARNAAVEIEKRLRAVNTELKKLEADGERLEAAIAERDEDALAEFTGSEKEALSPRQKKKAPDFNGARRFVSSEGYEILVGKASKDNDHLTFRVAKSFDLWMHAADYPGSHVVIKNPNRLEIPPKTLLEAAQIAAFYSHARQQPKAAVHYTQKKFVNKPKGAAPGLVSLSSFKTILVEPGIRGAEKKEAP